MSDAPIDQTTVALRPAGGEAPVTAEHLAQRQKERMEEMESARSKRQAEAEARNGVHVKGHHGLHGKQHRRVRQVQKLVHFHRSQRAVLKPLGLTSVAQKPTPPP